MARPLSENQKRLWAQVGEMLGRFVVRPEVTLDALPSPVFEQKIEPEVEAASEVVPLDVPPVEQVDVVAEESANESEPAFVVEEVALPPTHQDELVVVETDVAEELVPEPIEAVVIPEAPVEIADSPEEVPVLLPEPSRSERIALARDTFELESLSELPAHQFFSSISWSGSGSNKSAGAVVLDRAIEAPGIDVSAIGSRAFFSTCIPWAGRGQLPSREILHDERGTAPLRSLLAAATESALHAARRMAKDARKTSDARAGSASAFFQSLDWQRNTTDIAA